MPHTMNEGKIITCRAAVVWAKGEPFKIEEIQVAPPKANEIRLKMVATGICHSDASAWKGTIMGANFPVVLGHEGAGIVESVGEGVENFKPGDYAIPLFLPQCRQCKVCLNEDANFCLQFSGKQMMGLLPDGTTRLSCRGETLHTFVGCGTFSEYAVFHEMNLSKISKEAPLEKVCLLSCGVTTGYGAAINTAKVKAGSTCAVWGLGALGLSAIIGCKNAGAKKIFAIDINDSKEEIARECGATDFINPMKLEEPIAQYLMKVTGGGVDYTFEAVGSTEIMKQAFQSAAIGCGTCVLIGVSPSGQNIDILPLDVQVGRTLKGTFFGCYKSVDSVPHLVDDYLKGKLKFDQLITHTMGLDQINDAFQLLLDGKSIRTVINI